MENLNRVKIEKGQFYKHKQTGDILEVEYYSGFIIYFTSGRSVGFSSFFDYWELVVEKEFTTTYSGNIDLEPLKIKPLFGITSDKVVQSVMNDLNERSRVGVEKYGVTLEREYLNK